MGKLSKKRQQQFIEAYRVAPVGQRLNNVYSSCSADKQRAEQVILNEMTSTGGCAYKVISYNTFSFTCAYLNNTEQQLIVHTPTNKYTIDL